MLRKVIFTVVFLTVLVVGFLLFAGQRVERALRGPYHNALFENFDVAMKSADLDLGERTARVRTGCAECHGADLAGKVVVDDPAFGYFYAPNLTPFALKNWSDIEIAAAIRQGIHLSGRGLILMPANEYTHLTEHDLASVVAYLRSVPPVDKPNQPSKVGPVAKVLYTLGQLPTLVPAAILDLKAPFPTATSEAPTPEFGAYLAKTSCMGCHGPHYEGGKIAGGAPDWPPATNLRFKNRSAWSEEKFFSALRTGISPETGKEIRPPMPIGQTKNMTETELKALWMYFSQLE